MVTCKWMILRESHADLVSVCIHSAKKMHTELGCGIGGRVGILTQVVSVFEGKGSLTDVWDKKDALPLHVAQ